MLKQIFYGLFLGLIITLFFAQSSEWVHREFETAIQDLFSETMNCRVSCKVARLNFFVPTLELVDVKVGPKTMSKSNNDLSLNRSLKPSGEPLTNGENNFSDHNDLEKEKKLIGRNSSPSVRPEALEGPREIWSWRAKRYLTGFSWIHFLLHHRIKMWIELHDLDAYSSVDGSSVAIRPHLEALLSEVAIDIPMSINSLLIKHGRMHFFDPSAKRTLSCTAHAEMHMIHNLQKIHVSFLNGFGSQDTVDYFTALGGTLSCTVRDDAFVALSTDCHCYLPQLDAQSPVFVVGSWEGDEGKWRVYNAEDTLKFDRIALKRRPEGLWAFVRAQLPVAYCVSIAASNNTCNALLDGSFVVTGQGYLDRLHELEGQITFVGIKHAQHPYELNGKATFLKRDEQWKGELDAAINADAQFKSSWWYDEERDQGELVCKNQTALALPNFPYWHILPEAIDLRLVREKGKLRCAYNGSATHELLGTSNSVQGEVLVESRKGKLEGVYNDEKYTAIAQLDRFPYLESATYVDAQNHAQLSCAYLQEEACMHGTVQFSFVRSFIKRLFGYDLQGQGSLQFDVGHSADGWHGKVHLANGAIRLPETYNFINGIDAKFVYHEGTRRLTVQDLICEMHSGRVQCKQAVLWFDDQLMPEYVHIPLLFEHCMLNFKRDLFATVSGTLNIKKEKQEVPLLAGNLFIERAQTKENLLSQEFQKQLFTHMGSFSALRGSNGSSVEGFASHVPNLNCDLTIETMHPIKIETSVLKTSAQVNIAIKNNFANPLVSGAVRLAGGTIEFPYKPLNITEGVMYLLPGQLYDPMVELRAKNKIKNHIVSLQVTGQLSSHHIMFDASPPLSEEQIISLLLVGSHEESLATMAPALLVQNLKHALFGINEPSVLEKYMNKIAKPLNIHLVPSFTDQTGRGGLRGALEIDVNDRWRALIQKNFTLTEDTRFELDYLLSDDITIRAIRDERRDVGGEVEMKWKF